MGVPFMPDLHRLLASGLDAVITTAENSKHADLVHRCAAAAVHILCEKPLATSVADAHSMIEAARRHGVLLMTAFPCRYLPAVVQARQVVVAGGRGRGCDGPHGPRSRFNAGQEPVFIYAEIDRRFYDIPTDDCGTLAITFERGAFATLDPSWSRPAAFPTWGDVTLEIVGTKGRIAVDAFAQSLTLTAIVRARVAGFLGATTPIGRC